MLLPAATSGIQTVADIAIMLTLRVLPWVSIPGFGIIVRCYPSFVPPRIAIKIDINISHMDISHIRTVASCARALVEQCDDLCAD